MELISISRFKNLLAENKSSISFIIPVLIKKLVKFSLNNEVSTIEFNGGNDNNLTGFDGLVIGNKSECKFVPKGNSVFEIGTNDSKNAAKQKIIEDFRKRNGDETIHKTEFTFILITTSCLHVEKYNIKKMLEKESKFKDIKILDAYDIVEWLNESYAVLCWFENKLGFTVLESNQISLKDAWENLKSQTSLAITPDFFLIGNEDEAEKLIHGIESIKKTSIIYVYSQNFENDYTLYFCIASLLKNNNLDIIDRTSIISNETDFKHFNKIAKNSIFLVNFEIFDETLFTLNDSNNIYIICTINNENARQLKMYDKSDFVKAVENLGFSYENASISAKDCGYNLISFVKYHSNNPAYNLLNWKTKDHLNLKTLMLLNNIDIYSKRIHFIIEKIMQNDYETCITNLGEWIKVKNSPVMFDGTSYQICNRDYCFKEIKVPINSKSLRKLEEFVSSILLNEESNYLQIQEDDDSYYQRSNQQIINDILESFIIILKQDDKTKGHFDTYVKNIYEKSIKPINSISTVLNYAQNLSKLSPNAFLNFINDLLKNNVLSFTSASSNKFIKNIIIGLKCTLRFEKSASNGLVTMLDIYTLTKSEYLLQELTKILSPQYTFNGMISISQFDKVGLLMRYIKNIKEEIIYKLILNLFFNILSPLSIQTEKSYKTFGVNNTDNSWDYTNQTIITYFKWLICRTNDFDTLSRILKYLINYYPFNPNLTIDTLKSMADHIANLTDKIQADIYYLVLKTKNIIGANKDTNLYNGLSNHLNGFIMKLEPKDYYLKTYNFLSDELNSPIISAKCTNNLSTKEKIILRKEEHKQFFCKILEIYKEETYEKFIKDLNYIPKELADLFYEYSNDHFKILDLLIVKNEENSIKFFLQNFNDTELKNVIDTYNDPIIFRNLPSKLNVVDYLNNHPYEMYFWSNQSLYQFDLENERNINLIINKFKIYNPLNLIKNLININLLGQERCIRILEIFTNNLIEVLNSKPDSDEYNNYLDDLITFITEFNRLYDSSAIIHIVLRIVPFIWNKYKECPTCLKEWFLSHPVELRKFLIEICSEYRQTNTYFLYMLQRIPGNQIIPIKNISLDNNSLFLFITNFLAEIDSLSEDEQNILLKIAINILASLQYNPNDTFWNPKVIEPCLDYMNSLNHKTSVDIVIDCAYSITNQITYNYKIKQSFKALYSCFLNYANKCSNEFPFTKNVLKKVSEIYYDLDKWMFKQ